MQVITITTEAYQQIIDKIDAIAGSMNKKKDENPLSDTWLSITEACRILKISSRTMQKYRDEGIIPYSQIQSKIYFRASDIEFHLNKHYKSIKK